THDLVIPGGEFLGVRISGTSPFLRRSTPSLKDSRDGRIPGNQGPDHRPRGIQPRILMDACFDSMTRQKLDDLAKRFRRPCAAVLCHFMHWGLSYESIG